ncbi:MAG TPA: ribokinase [Methylomirabilota bacterium]|nr:ribokinase [Methylomirabilota bacterium]
MPRICVIGSANVDLTVKTSRLPEPGETVSGGELLIAHGGKGANQAVAARRLDTEVRFTACLGLDAFGDQVAQHLANAGLPQDRLVRVTEARTGVALIVVDQSGQNQIAVAPGANHLLTVDRVEDREADIAWADVLLLQLETPLETVHWALRCAQRHRVLTILNPAPFRPIPEALIPLIDILTPNEREAESLSGVSGQGATHAREAGERLRQLGFKNIVITLGAYGVFSLGVDEEGTHVKGFSVGVVDTTAAGDAFNGALACRLASGSTLGEAVTFANAAAALACTKRGAQESLPDRPEVERFLRSQL